MTFKRMMALGAVAAALTFTGCQDRSRDQQGLGTGVGDQTQPATGGSGNVDSTIPGASDTIGGTEQDNVRPGTELGGTGDTESDLGSGGSGSLNQQDNAGDLDQGGTGGSGSMNSQDNAGSMDHGGSGSVHQPGTGDSLDHGGTGGSGTDLGTSGDLDQDQRNQLDDQDTLGGSDDAAR